MPLLRRQPFKKQELPENLQPNEELFYCKLTNEVFRDYNTFFERVILCNSLVWTCQLTGRPSLTYLEAIESEERARNSLAAIPVALKRTLLYLARLTKCGRLSDLCDDVFHFVKDRFFVGEEVEAAIDGDRRCCKVVKVLSQQSSGKRKGSTSSANANSADILKPDDDADLGNCNVELDPAHCRYQVCDCDDPDRSLHVLTADDILRKKGVYSREKNRLFLKHTCELRGGQWLLKDKFIDKYNVNEMKFGDIFAGCKPNLESLASKRKPSSVSPSNHGGGAKSKSKDGEKKRHDSKSSSKNNGSDKSENHSKKKKLSTKEKEAIALKEAQQIIENRLKAKEEQKLKIEEERKKKKEERDKEREKLREERRIMAECLREWQKPRDDLECDDLVDLPPPVPIACSIPNELFGDAVMVLEFVHNFSEQLSTKDSFPYGFTLELLERALVEKDVQGPLNDLLQMLIRAIFSFQEEEEDVEKEDRKNTWVSHAAVDLSRVERASNDAVQAAREARTTASWLAYYHGSLRKMTLDAFTLTEVLRLHLLISGSRNMTMDYSPYSDPGLLLRLEEPSLLCALAKQTVFDISPGDKLKVLKALTSQLLAHYSLRDEIEERLEKLRVAKQDLRMMQWAEQRREREEAALRFKRKMEQRAKAAGNVDDSTQETKDGKTEKSKASIEKEKKRLEEELRLEEERQAVLENKLKQEFLKKEKELSEIVAKHFNRGAMFPLGRDRAYRRFWMFNALPGLFIEDDDKEVGVCLAQPTPYNPNSNPYMSFNNSINIARQRNSGGDPCHNASDKENEANGQICQNQNCGHRSHKLLSDNHPTMNGIIDSGTPMVGGLVNGLKSELANGEEAGGKATIFGMCNGKGESCDVHGCRTCIRWGFYPTVGHVESLIASLNPRGFREGCLKEILVAEKRKVVQSVGRCPVSKLNTTLVSNELDLPKEQEVRKSNRLQPAAAIYPEGTTMHDFLELTFRDSILEMEEKIYAGGLGSLKVKDRMAWREAILQHTYDRQSEDLRWGTKETRNGQVAGESTKLTNGIGHSPVNASSIKTDTPVSDVSQSTLIKEMASALLQIYQGIEVKYLIAPLVPDKEGDSSSASSRHKSYAERWEDSLMSSSSLSQLFVHLATLEKCVAWSRSALNARCRICRRKKDAEHMLLCDGCDRGHHMYCLKPPLKEIPEGEWLCQDCAPKEKPPRKSRKRQVEEEEEKEEEEMEAEEDEEEEEEVEEDVESESDTSYRETRSSRYKREVESDSGSDSEGSSSDDKIVNNDFCEVCEKGGHLICCDHCPLSYHLECINPPLRRVPRGIWDCPKCCEYKPAAKKSRPTIKLQKYTKLFKVEEKQPRQTRQVRSRTSIPKEEISPRRSSRNSGRGTKRDKHSSLFDEDEWDTCTTRRKQTRNAHQKEISDEEYYGLRKKLTPPSRRGASMDVPLDFKTCDQLLTELVRNEDSWPFLRPVGKKELPMYHEVVKRPMDFGTMRSKLNAMAYQSNKEYVLDVFLIFQNCILYNPVNSIQYMAAYRLGKLFEERVDELRLNLATPDASRTLNGIYAKRKRRRRSRRDEDDAPSEDGEEKVAKSENSSVSSTEGDEEEECDEEDLEEEGDDDEEEEEEGDEIHESGEDEAMETDTPSDGGKNSADSSADEDEDERSNGPEEPEEEA